MPEPFGLEGRLGIKVAVMGRELDLVGTGEIAGTTEMTLVWEPRPDDPPVAAKIEDIVRALKDESWRISLAGAADADGILTKIQAQIGSVPGFSQVLTSITSADVRLTRLAAQVNGPLTDTGSLSGSLEAGFAMAISGGAELPGLGVRIYEITLFVKFRVGQP